MEETRHFTGRVRLAKQPRAAKSLEEIPGPAAQMLGSEVIYDLYFHGPAYQVLDGAWSSGDRVVGRLPDMLPLHHRPAEQGTLTGPRLAELCFQTAGLIEFSGADRVGLPRRVAQIRLFGSISERAGVLALVEKDDAGGFSATVVDASGDVLLEMSGYSTIESSMTMDPEPLAELRRVLAQSDAARTT